MKQPDRVLAIGVFDLFHIGHLRFLQYAKAQGRHLSVAVWADAVSQRYKGKTPVIHQDQRLEIIQGLACVDHAALQLISTEDTQGAAQWIAEWQVQQVVVGGNWEGSARWQRLTAALAMRHIRVSYAPHTAGICTTDLVQRVAQMHSPPSEP